MPEVMTEALKSADGKAKAQSSQVSDGPLFVVGMFRSGTSLLYVLLNQHPEIALLYEDDLAHVPSLFWFPTKTSRWMAKWDSWNGGPSRHKVTTSELPADISDIRTAAREVYVTYAQKKKGASIWGSKSPTFFDSLARLGRTFPNARFVIIWRDLNDVCNSICKAAQVEGGSYFSRRGMLVRAMIGYHDMKVQCDWLKKHGFPVHEIHYEDLVSDSLTTMQGICGFLQIPFDPKMCSLQGADRSVIENREHHTLVKSEKILKPKNSRSVLPPALEAKVSRYLHRWRKKYKQTWPVYPRSLNGTGRGPSLPELWRDNLAYLALRFWYHSIPVIFCLVPTAAWETYRKVTRHSYDWQEGQTEGVKPGKDQSKVAVKPQS